MPLRILGRVLPHEAGQVSDRIAAVRLRDRRPTEGANADAGTFLNKIYINSFSALKIGRARTG
jgi:hypothetical protein